MKIYYNSIWSNVSEQKNLHALLPVSHEYADKKSVLEDGTTLAGRQAHDDYMSVEMRIKTRKRCLVLTIRPTESKQRILSCFVAVPDWHAPGLDVETFFLRNYNTTETLPLPRVGPYSFSFPTFMSSVYEDIQMSFAAVKDSLEGRKCHLKIVPLGVGPTIRTRYGEFIGNLIIPPYLLALQYACNVSIDDSWVDTLEFVDHFKGAVSPILNVKKVRIISASSRDAFDYGMDYTDTGVVPAIIAPMDTFCRLGGTENEKNKNIAYTMASGSDLRQCVIKDPEFKAWPIVKDGVA